MREDKSPFIPYIITFTQPYNLVAHITNVDVDPMDICSPEAAKKAEIAAAECIERWMHPKFK